MHFKNLDFNEIDTFFCVLRRCFDYTTPVYGGSASAEYLEVHAEYKLSTDASTLSNFVYDLIIGPMFKKNGALVTIVDSNGSYFYVEIFGIKIPKKPAYDEKFYDSIIEILNMVNERRNNNV